MSDAKIIDLAAKRLEKSFEKARAAAKAKWEKTSVEASVASRHGNVVTRIPTQQEYEAREFRQAQRKEHEVEHAPLSERKEAQSEFLSVMRERPDIVAERIEWLLEGNYGFGQMKMAQGIADSPRMNREAGLTQMIAVYEWNTPRRMAVDAWKKLTSAEKSKLSKAVAKAISNYEKRER